ncbi:MAG: hypothetical protein R6W90_15095 [Ignavibacteriaceae bacterium]
MKAKIIKMGNSAGICIPKIILEQCRMEGFVDIQILEDKLVIKPVEEEIAKNLKRKEQEKTFEESLSEACWYEDETEWK